MAQGDGYIYNKAKQRILAGEIDLDGHTIKLALVQGYTPNIDTHLNWSDVSSAECAGTNYTAGGKALTTLAVTVDNTNDLGKFDADDVTWTALRLTTPANGTPSHCILYDDTHVNNALIAYWELTTATNGGDYTVQWNASGIVTLT